jgi:hypothetical protein
LRQRLGALNPRAPLFEVVRGDIDPALLFDSGPFEPAGKNDRVRQWLNAAERDDQITGVRRTRSIITSIARSIRRPCSPLARRGSALTPGVHHAQARPRQRRVQLAGNE